jgi:hypothetical protein
MAYIASGGIIVGGCATTSKLVCIGYNWVENTMLFVKQKALVGIMEKVVIKEVLIHANRRTHYKKVVIYKDTLNSLWNEYDLIPESEARELALAYWLDREVEMAAILACQHQ